ncbi:MAG: sulfatase-like hydrolase/transferase [Opitutales bacterium]|nr:sulfatase-like hydrolase/transferase [Opitutales bacterium]
MPTEWNTLIEAGHFPSGPYRGRKADIWEGGHRVPFMVRWPNRIEAGLVNDDILSLNDLFATCAELLGSVLPNDAGEDSISFLSTIFGENDEPHRGHVVSHSVGGEFAYMEGSWKVVYKNAVANRNQSRGKSRIVELYNLEEDIAEANNLSENELEIAERLGESLKRIVARGTSRAGPIQANDAEVNVEVTQTVRWVASLAEGED